MNNDYITFIKSEINLGCKKDAQCCSTFGYDGSKIEQSEKEKIISHLKQIGLERIASAIDKNNSIPTQQGEPLQRKCSLLENQKCLIHKNKPTRCTDYPLFIQEKEDGIYLEVDTTCKSVTPESFDNSLKENFQNHFQKPLKIKFTNSIENRARRYLND